MILADLRERMVRLERAEALIKEAGSHLKDEPIAIEHRALFTTVMTARVEASQAYKAALDEVKAAEDRAYDE